MSELSRTPLYDRHVAAGARMVPFAGFEMPVQYQGLIAEHLQVRSDAGLFDVSHMGEFFAEGEGALAAVDHLVTADIAALADGQAGYAGLLDENGGFVDDVVVYRFSETKLLICVNAANVAKDFAHATAHWPDGGPSLTNQSDDWAQLAAQGPKAEARLAPLTETDLSAISRYHFTEGQVAGVDCIIARTGYTGEDGFELFCANDGAAALWDALVEAGFAPAGLGARDTLRLEMKYALYGNDIDETTTPWEAGLGWIVAKDKSDFVGRDALLAQKEAGIPRRLIAFELTGKGVPRAGMDLVDEAGEAIGRVTSGTMSPSLKKPIGMAYVPWALRKTGTELAIDVRGRRVPAVVVRPPFVEGSA